MSLNYDFVLNILLRSGRGGSRLLDFGCGSGEMVARALEAGYDAFGVDTFAGVGDSAGHLGNATHRLGARAMQVVPDAPLPFEDAFFDVVVSNQVFEHIADLAPVATEIARVTRPGGLLVALLPTAEVLWEDHLKMPWVHRLQNGSARQRALMHVLLQLGFGRSRELLDDAWIAMAVEQLRDVIHHRPARDYVAAFARDFRLLEEAEPAWARHRLAHHPALQRGAWLAGSPVLDRMLRSAVRRLAGAMLVFERRASSGA